MGGTNNGIQGVTLRTLLLALLLALWAGPASAPGAPRPDAAAGAEPGRIVAIADIHGDLASFTAILQKAGLVDARNRWVAQGVTLVQTGDTVDRGAHSRAVLDLLMELEKQAPKKRSRVISLLGNHEVMNITGDLRYVTPPEYAEFADSKSEKRRAAAWKQLADWKKARAKALGQPAPVVSEEPDPAWLEAHPVGYFEHRDAYGPRGKYGKWLRQHDAVVLVGDTLFVHGGISPNLPSASIADINARIRDELALFDQYMTYLTQQQIILPFSDLTEIASAVQEELQARTAELAEKSAKATAEGKTYEPTQEEKRQVEILAQFLEFPSWYSINQEGPLWYRGYSQWSAEEGPALADQVLTKYGAKAIVVGHTPLKGGRMLARFDGRIFLIDTGMLSSYYEGGRASALEINRTTYTAVYMDQSSVLHPARTVPVDHAQEEDSLLEEPGGGVPFLRTGQEAAHAKPAPAGAARHVWLGPEGQPLPFRDDGEVMEFLRTARVVSMKDVGSGVTRPRKLLLEKDGVEMHAIFRTINSEKPLATMRDGRRIRNFRDSYMLEIAAYEMAQLMGIDAIPPVVERRIGGEDGSVQVWVEQAMTETKRQEEKVTPPDVRQWNQQLQTMRLFDLLISNWDRHTDNILVDGRWKLWMVDHTRSFRREDDTPYLNQIILCERGFWERLQKVDDENIRQRLQGILRSPEIAGLLRRRQNVVQYLRERIARTGEADVLFSR